MTTCATGIDSWRGPDEARRTQRGPLAALAGTALFVAGVGSGATFYARLDPHGSAVVSDCGAPRDPRWAIAYLGASDESAWLIGEQLLASGGIR